MKINKAIILGAALGLAASHAALAQTTAMQLVKKGDQYVGVQSKDKVIEIYSDRSVASIQPNIWHVVYYDPTVFSKSVEVKFEAGQETDVTHPMRPFQLPAKSSQILDLSKVTVDSDHAIQIATSQPVLNGLHLRSSQATLKESDSGPEWKVELWSAKVSDPDKDANVGYVRISATDGSIVESNLHPGSAR